MDRIGEGQLSFLRDVLRKQTLGNIVITGNLGLERHSKKTMIKPHENISLCSVVLMGATIYHTIVFFWYA